MKKLVFLLLFICGATHPVKIDAMAFPPLSDSAQVSLITDYPWQGEAYAIYGHSALRFLDTESQTDLIFNYGIFNSNIDNFILLFVQGKTDYIVAQTPFVYAIQEYIERDVSIEEQVLSLTVEEKQNLWQALQTNCLPQNRVYRYNFLYDNCATRLRDMIENNIEGTLEYSSRSDEKSFRQLLAQFTGTSPWMRFGINLVLGSEIDCKATEKEQMFLPLYMRDAFAGATVTDEKGKRNLVESSHILYQGHDSGNKPAPSNSPLFTGCALFLLTITLMVVFIKKQLFLPVKILTALLFFPAGIAGSVIFFLMFFSVHPAVNPNWNLIWLNPLQLLVIPFFFFKRCSRPIFYYHFIQFAVLLCFVLAYFLLPQKMEIAFLPYILAISLSSGAWVVISRNITSKNNESV